MESLGNKDQGFSVVSQHASCEPVQKPEENSCICKTNQANRIILTQITDILIGFCKWSLPLGYFFHSHGAIQARTQISAASLRTKAKTQTPTPKVRCVITHHDLEKGEEAKPSLALPSLSVCGYFHCCRERVWCHRAKAAVAFHCLPPSSLTKHQCFEAAGYIL